MPSWLLEPNDGGDPQIVQSERGKRPSDHGIDEAAFRVTRLARGIADGERVIDGKVRACPHMAEQSARRARRAEIGLDAWLEERVAELVDARLAALGIAPTEETG